MVIRICDYDGKMGEMLETGIYRKLKRNSTATPGERLCYQLDTCSPFSLFFPTTHPPSCFSSLLSPCPQVGRGLRQEHKGPISRLLMQYLENANHSVGYQHVVCVCVCVLPCLNSRIRHNFRSIKHHLRKMQLRSTGLQKKKKNKRKIHCGPASFITEKGIA